MVAGKQEKIAWASDGTKPASGLVWGLNSQNLAPYTIAALDKFYSLFPEIKETQFRMHNESGLLDSEIDDFWHKSFISIALVDPNHPGATREGIG